MDDKKIEDYEEMLKICGDFMHHQNEYIKKLESQLITSRESQSAVSSEKLAQWFENNSDCYADTDDDTVILAMTKEKFVELLQRGIAG